MTKYVPCQDERRVKIRYALRLMLLQERACLSFKEARTYLRKERNETYEILAECFSTDVEGVKEIERRATDKVNEILKKYDIFMDYDPILPEDGLPFDTDVSDETYGVSHQ